MSNNEKDDAELIRKAMGFSEDPKPPGDRVREAQAEGRAALRSAEKAARRHDLAAAKKWTDVARRMADVAAELAAAPAPAPSWEEDATIRDELERRLTLLAGDDEKQRRWHIRLEIWNEMAAESQRTGAPMPPPMPTRPPHWSDTLPDHLRQRFEDYEEDAI